MKNENPAAAKNQWVLMMGVEPGGPDRLVMSNAPAPGGWVEAPDSPDKLVEMGCVDSGPLVNPNETHDDMMHIAVADYGKKVVPGTVYSDDQSIEGSFNGTPWLEQATYDQLIEIAEADWRGERADEIAYFLEARGEPVAKALFSYLATDPHAYTNEAIGFEVELHEGAVMAWLEENRPDVHARITGAEPAIPS